MIVYLSAAMSRREEMRAIRSELNSLGVMVLSRWLEEPEPPNDGQQKFLRESAFVDIQDVLGSNMLVRFSDDLTASHIPSQLATGARFFEMGLAWREGIPIAVVGGKQCLFDFLPGIIHLADKEALKRFLAPYEVN